MFSFRLNEAFVDRYRNVRPDWGFTDAAGSSLGEITFLRTYSRKKEDGSKEQWYEVCERVINGMYSIQKDYAKANRLPWSDSKAQASAQEAFARLFEFKWTPPGRGLWVMGTPLVNEHKNSAALQNCAFVSTGDMTKNNPAEPFAFLMEASMLGVGVGFDLKGAEKEFKIYEPTGSELVAIPDTREGWVESVARLINAYLKPGKPFPEFYYGDIRPKGSPIKTFGGTAAGPEPLRKLHQQIRSLFEGRAGEYLTRMDILDIMNLLGVCVVAGNVRRSAELALGEADDLDFVHAKDPEVFPERNSYDPENPGWAWMSNNSVVAHVGQDLSHLAYRIAANGEPGVIWLDLARDYGRLVDRPNGRDYRVAGFNPCAEQSLESFEMCTLVETYPSRHKNLEDYLRTLKFAYLYAKTVTLLPTHWERTNAIMARNRRIGTSASGISDFVDNRSWSELRVWMDSGYEEIQKYDRIYSEWLCVRESIKTTTVKPSGTVSILAGVSPGVHWSPGGRYFLRRIRFRKDDPMVEMLRLAGYDIEPASEDPEGTVVVGFPIKSTAKRSEHEVTIFEKAHLAAEMQRYWSDNAVSVTLSFDKEKEAKYIPAVLSMYDGKLKTVSFLPMGNETYPQMPYESITPEEYEAGMNRFPVDLTPIYEGLGIEAIGERFCSTDACEVKDLRNN